MRGKLHRIPVLAATQSRMLNYNHGTGILDQVNSVSRVHKLL